MNQSIQVFRGVLFLFILAFHCGAPYANFGWGGVEAFFVISSFFLVRKYWGSEKVLVKEQFMHRIKRLYPPYLVVLFGAALCTMLKGNLPLDFVTHILSAQNFQWMITGYKSAMQPMTAHTWTLSIEVWDGLVWLLLLKCLSKERFKGLMYVMVMVGISYRIISVIAGADAWVVSLCPLAHFDAFACGSLLAVGVKEDNIDSKVGILSIAGATGLLCCIGYISRLNDVSLISAYQLLSTSNNYLNNWFTANIYLFISLLTTGLVGLLYIHDTNGLKEKSLIRKLFVKLGDNSYALYLFHWPILVVMKHLHFIGGHHWWMLLLSTLVLTIITVLIYNWIYACIQKKSLGRS